MPKTLIIGKQGQQRIPLTQADISRKHCSITDNGDGTLILKDLGSTYGTFVNGNQVLQKNISIDTVIQLGNSYKVKVRELLPPGFYTPEFSVKPLEYVWNEYNNRILAITNNQKKVNMLRSASPIFTIGSGAVATVAKTAGLGDGIFYVTGFMTIFGLILMIYSFIQGMNDKSTEEREEATLYLQDNYLCPNPSCKHFIGMKHYNILKKETKCPYCGCKYNSN